MASTPFHENRLLIANGRHIAAAIKKALPDGFVLDDVKIGDVVFKKGTRFASAESVCVAAVRRKNLTTGYQKKGLYHIVIDMYDAGQIRVSEWFEWRDWPNTRGMSSGRSPHLREKTTMLASDALLTTSERNQLHEWVGNDLKRYRAARAAADKVGGGFDGHRYVAASAARDAVLRAMRRSKKG